MKTLRFLAIVVLSAAIAFGIGVGVLALSGNDRAFFCTFFFGAIAIALGLGAFNVERKDSRYESIKHRSGRNYGQAAIMLGTVCLYMGSPQDCEELCDDLWHRGVQAEVRALTGEMEFEIL